MKKGPKMAKIKKILVLCSSIFLILVVILPYLISWTAKTNISDDPTIDEFPVTVYPQSKMIVENEMVNSFLAEKHSLLGAAVGESTKFLWSIVRDFAVSIMNASWYENVANVSTKIVVIKPGMRKEQIADTFGDILKWNNKQRKAFIAENGESLLGLKEGSYAPGTYSVTVGMKPEEIQNMMSIKFTEDVLSHYSSSTQAIVPIDQAINIASLIQRETVSTDGMRLLSGIIWNRIFKNMNLQIDSTLQYAKANKTVVGAWWPKVTPSDKYIKSPYNTYMNNGLPPTPIANPSVEAILAALNPIETKCLFYFNDKNGDFHCSETYDQHVKLIKQYYGN